MKLTEGHKHIAPPKGVPVWDIDPYDAEILSNPEPYYARLRELGPFVYLPKYSALACGRHVETKEVFSDWERFVSSRGVGLNDFKLVDPWRAVSIILEVDPPDHAITRKVMARALSPKAVMKLKEMFQATAEQLVDELLQKGSFDAVVDLAEAYPTRAFVNAVGLKENDPRKLIDYGAMVFNALGPDNQIRRDAMANAPDIVPWITQACERENLDEDGLGAALYAAADAGDINHEQAGMLTRSLLSAGVDTTATGLGSAIWCLANNPDAFEALKADLKLARPCFEEVLRFTSPVHTFCRTANLDTQVSGIDIEEGTKILCVLGAANLDPTHWEWADQFQIDRRPMGHMAFGAGVHGCVGQNIARAELEAVLTAIAKKVERIECAGEAVWRPNNAIHALDRMPVQFIPR